jgi:hypothetical protein
VFPVSSGDPRGFDSQQGGVGRSLSTVTLESGVNPPRNDTAASSHSPTRRVQVEFHETLACDDRTSKDMAPRDDVD